MTAHSGRRSLVERSLEFLRQPVLVLRGNRGSAARTRRSRDRAAPGWCNRGAAPAAAKRKWFETALRYPGSRPSPWSRPEPPAAGPVRAPVAAGTSAPPPRSGRYPPPPPPARPPAPRNSQIDRIVSRRLPAAETQRPQPVLRRRQRQQTQRMDAARPDHFREPRIPGLRIQFRDHQRALILQTQPAMLSSMGDSMPVSTVLGSSVSRMCRRMVSCARVVQREVQEIELHHTVQPLRQVVEQRRQIVMHARSTRTPQQGAVLGERRVGLRFDSLILATAIERRPERSSHPGCGIRSARWRWRHDPVRCAPRVPSPPVSGGRCHPAAPAS